MPSIRKRYKVEPVVPVKTLIEDPKLPDDTVAEIISAGLLGDKYMSLVPGGSDKVIPPGGKITYTQSSISLENLIGQMMFSAPGPKKEGDAAAPASGAAPSQK